MASNLLAMAANLIAMAATALRRGIQGHLRDVQLTVHSS